MDEEAVYSTTGQPRPQDLEQVALWLLNEPFAQAYALIAELQVGRADCPRTVRAWGGSPRRGRGCPGGLRRRSGQSATPQVDRGLALVDIVRGLLSFVFRLNIPPARLCSPPAALVAPAAASLPRPLDGKPAGLRHASCAAGRSAGMT